MSAGGEPRPGADPLSAGEALALFGAAYLLLHFLFIPLQARNLVPGLIVSEYGGLLAMPLLYTRLTGRRVTAAFALGRPDRLALLGAGLMGSAGWIIADLLTTWIFPPPKEFLEQLRHLLFPRQGGRGLWANLLLFALTPALCEEMFFRGALLRGLLQRLSPAAAIGVCALAFGIFHVDPYRLLPTTVLGVMLSFIAWRSASLWPAVLAHFVNNGLVVALGTAGIDERLEALGGAAQAGLFAAALAVVAAGVLALERAARERGQV